MKQVTTDAVSVLNEKLKLIPAVKEIKIIGRSSGRISAEIYTAVKNTVQLLTVSKAYPGVIEQKLKAEKEKAEDAYLVIAASYISEASSEVCKKYGAGYIDYSGNCLISLDSIYISDTGHENLFPKEDSAKNILKFSSKTSSKILKLLLKNTDTVWRLKKLSEDAGCSIGMVARVKDYLCSHGWAEMNAEGLKITNAEGLLSAWSENYEIPKSKIMNAYTLSSVPDFEKQASEVMKENGLCGCLTAFSAGARFTPVVRYSKAYLWVKNADLYDFINKTDIKQVDSGANVVIYIADSDEFMFGSKEINGCPVASAVQIYLDLMQQKGRGEEMAEALLSKEILK